MWRLSLVWKKCEDCLLHRFSAWCIIYRASMKSYRWLVYTEHRNIFLDTELPSVQLSFLWCTVLGIGTTEKVFVRRECTLPFTNEHRVLWELAKWWWLLKVWASLALFDRIIETISMAFSRNIFQAYSGIFVLKIIFSHFDKPRKAQNVRAAAAP